MKINMLNERMQKGFSELRIGEIFIEREECSNHYCVQMKITPNSEGNTVFLYSGEVSSVASDTVVELVEAELNIL